VDNFSQLVHAFFKLAKVFVIDATRHGFGTLANVIGFFVKAGDFKVLRCLEEMCGTIVVSTTFAFFALAFLTVFALAFLTVFALAFLTVFALAFLTVFALAFLAIIALTFLAIIALTFLAVLALTFVTVSALTFLTVVACLLLTLALSTAFFLLAFAFCLVLCCFIVVVALMAVMMCFVRLVMLFLPTLVIVGPCWWCHAEDQGSEESEILRKALSFHSRIIYRGLATAQMKCLMQDT